jgi:hypothetical protein
MQESSGSAWLEFDNGATLDFMRDGDELAVQHCASRDRRATTTDPMRRLFRVNT